MNYFLNVLFSKSFWHAMKFIEFMVLFVLPPLSSFLCFFSTLSFYRYAFLWFLAYYFSLCVVMLWFITVKIGRYQNSFPHETTFRNGDGYSGFICKPIHIPNIVSTNRMVCSCYIIYVLMIHPLRLLFNVPLLTLRWQSLPYTHLPQSSVCFHSHIHHFVLHNFKQQKLFLCQPNSLFVHDVFANKLFS